MNKNLTCNQVSALINFYIEDKLNQRLREYVEIHLAKCPYCKSKIQELKNILAKYKNTPKRQAKTQPALTIDILGKISAYADNELNIEDNIKVKKMTISNPTARQELENIYKFKKAIQSSYEKTKNNNKFDYSKSIMNKMQNEYDYNTTYFYKLAALFAMILIAIICGFIYLYFY